MGVNDFIKIGDKIKQLRQEKKISQKDMSKILGLNASTYSNYENNHREPGSDIIVKIAEALDVTIPYLLYGIENEDNYTNFQAFIDYCSTLGYSIETCVSNSELDDIHFVRLDNGNIYTLSPEAVNRMMDSVEDYANFILKTTLEKEGVLILKNS